MLKIQSTLSFRATLIQSWDYGTYRFSLDGQELATLDLYSPEVKSKAARWGMRQLAAGSHVLRCECTGKSEKSKGYFLGFDSLAAAVPVYQRPVGFDLRKIQK